MTREHRLERTQLIPAPLSEVFAFFADAANLQRLTPTKLSFEILTPLPIGMRVGALIEYRIRLSGIPMRWLTEITRFEPERCFVDEQLRGPYKRWVHLHEFRSLPDGQTEMRDRVDYELPFGPLGSLAHHFVVQRTLQGIFDFRRQAVAREFPVSS